MYYFVTQMVTNNIKYKIYLAAYKRQKVGIIRPPFLTQVVRRFCETWIFGGTLIRNNDLFFMLSVKISVPYHIW